MLRSHRSEPPPSLSLVKKIIARGLKDGGQRGVVVCFLPFFNHRGGQAPHNVFSGSQSAFDRLICPAKPPGTKGGESG